MDNRAKSYEKFEFFNFGNTYADEEKTFEGFPISDNSWTAADLKKFVKAFRHEEKLFGESNFLNASSKPIGKQCHRFDIKKNMKQCVASNSKPVPVCLFCHQEAGLGNKEVELGKFYTLGKITVHYYCLLFSSALVQKGADNEGIEGFLPNDIEVELKRGGKLRCRHCKKTGATINCSHKKCKKIYHFPCGLDKYAQFDFTSNFSSLCDEHRKYQDGDNLWEEVECPICFETVKADPKTAIWPNCCQNKKKGEKLLWFHKICILKVGLSTGLHHFKCPLCNCNSKEFKTSMQVNGVFLPDRDASWELVENAFAELTERPNECFFEKCKCPSGKATDKEKTLWELVMCNLCGSSCMHRHCANLPLKCHCKDASICNEFVCPGCVEILRENDERIEDDIGSQKVYKKRKTCKRHKSHKKKSLQVLDNNSDELHAEIHHSKLPMPMSPTSRLPFQQLDNLSSAESDLAMSSNNFEENMPISDDETCFRENFNCLVIRDLEINRVELPPPLREVKTYADNFPVNLVRTKRDESDILETINHASKYSNVTEITLEHIKRFIRCSFNFSQMQVMKKLIEFVFKLWQCRSQLSPNLIAEGESLISDYEKFLVKILEKCTEVNLLEGNNFLPEEDNILINLATLEENALRLYNSEKPFNKTEKVVICPQSAEYKRVRYAAELDERCLECSAQLIPGYHQTTVKLSLGELQIICSSCLTCNIIEKVFQQWNFSGKISSHDEQEEHFKNKQNNLDEHFSSSKLSPDSIKKSSSKHKYINDYLSKSGKLQMNEVKESISSCVSNEPQQESEKNPKELLSSHIKTALSSDIVKNEILSTTNIVKTELLNSGVKKKALEDSFANCSTSIHDVSLSDIATKKDLDEAVKWEDSQKRTILLPNSNVTKFERNKRKVEESNQHDSEIKKFKVDDKNEPKTFLLSEGHFFKSEKRKRKVIKYDPKDSEIKKIKVDDKNVEKTISSDNVPKSRVSSTFRSSSIDTQTVVNKIESVEIKATVNDLKKVRIESKSIKGEIEGPPPPAHEAVSLVCDKSNKTPINKLPCNMCHFAGKESGTYNSYARLECKSCTNQPTFCSLNHFDLWHTVEHNWMVLPETNLQKYPVKNCKVCKDQKPTRYYCPACKPDIVGFCSFEHFKEAHIGILPNKREVTKGKLELEQELRSNETNTTSSAVCSANPEIIEDLAKDTINQNISTNAYSGTQRFSETQSLRNIRLHRESNVLTNPTIIAPP